MTRRAASSGDGIAITETHHGTRVQQVSPRRPRRGVAGEYAAEAVGLVERHPGIVDRARVRLHCDGVGLGNALYLHHWRASRSAAPKSGESPSHFLRFVSVAPAPRQGTLWRAPFADRTPRRLGSRGRLCDGPSSHPGVWCEGRASGNSRSASLQAGLNPPPLHRPHIRTPRWSVWRRP